MNQDRRSGQRCDLGPYVLIVDDEPLVRWSIGETLREAGYGVLEATDVQSAIVQLRSIDGRCDAILLDLWLADSHDWRVLQELHARSSVPIIVMTAHATPETAQEALSLGACTFLNKPFSMSDVAKVIGDARSRSISRR